MSKTMPETSVPAGSYVIPNDVVAAPGDGDSALGKLVVDEVRRLPHDSTLLEPDSECAGPKCSPAPSGNRDWITKRARAYLDALRDSHHEAITERVRSEFRAMSALRTKARPRKRTELEQQAQVVSVNVEEIAV